MLRHMRSRVASRRRPGPPARHASRREGRLGAPVVEVAARRAADADPAERVARRVGDRLAAQTRPAPIAPLAQLVAADELTDSTSLRARAALRVRIDEDGEQAVLVLTDRTLSLPRPMAEALKVMLSGDPFTAAELPGLDADDRLLLARRLMREGVIVAG